VSIRRIGRFIQLSLLGAADCLQKLSGNHINVPENTAVYLASENGDMETTVDVLDAMYRHNQPPKPLSFINTVSNAACFYIGSTFHLRGESSFISSIGLAFECALTTAVVDLGLHRVPAALVGSVDICTLPLHAHRMRIDAPNQVALGEASHWLLLSHHLDGIKPQAQLVAIEHIATLAQLLEKMNPISFNGILSLGQHLSADDKQRLNREYSGRVDDYSSTLPFYNSQSGYAIVSFLYQENERELLHVNKNREGMYCFYYLRKA